MGSANLFYYIREGVLEGTVNGEPVRISTYSGGGSGYDPANPRSVRYTRDTEAANNPYRTRQLTNEALNTRGGPIPPGRYSIKKPDSESKNVSLEPLNPIGFFRKTGRTGGFLIHGAGPKGSDGCLVPASTTEFKDLMDKLKSSDGGTLWVLESVEGDMFG